MKKLIIGNKTYSSWSMRPWIAMRQSGIAFEEILVELDVPQFQASVQKYYPAAKVPVLIDEDVRVGDSLAILEYLAEVHPEAGIWPKDRLARSAARAACAEMHSSFSALRGQMPMNLSFKSEIIPTSATANDIRRIIALWRELRAAHGAAGPFLCGEFSAVDAFYAPVVSRFESYCVQVPADIRTYMDHVQKLSSFQAWTDDAAKETRFLLASELYREPDNKPRFV